MAFTRIRPAAFGANTVLTSAEMTTLDIDHANALDKTGDAITGVVTVGAAGQVSVASGSEIDVLSGGSIDIQSGGQVHVLSGGAIVLDGTVYPTFGSSRTREVIFATCDLPRAGGTSAGTLGYVTAGVGETISFGLPTHDGAQLVGVDVYWIPMTGHAALPAVLPSLQVQRKNYAVGATVAVDDLAATTQQFFVAGTLADYNNGLIHKMSYTTTTNALITRSSYAYHVIIVDESGANSLAAANYVGIGLRYTVSSMKFQ